MIFRTALFVIGIAWNLPNTLVGILIGALNFTLPQYSHGAVNFYMTRGPVHGICHLLRISAFTVGECVLYAVPPSPNLRTHEYRHILQYRVLGVFFLPVYFVLLGMFGYVRHPLERDARDYELRMNGEVFSSRLVNHND